MEESEDVIIVGAGIAGLATALALHRLGRRSLVLESSDRLRSSGFALAVWPNAWRALDVLGISSSLRRQHMSSESNPSLLQLLELSSRHYSLLCRIIVCSTATGSITSRRSFRVEPQGDQLEVRCVKRSSLIDALAKELPLGTVRLSSKVAHVENHGALKVLHLADGSLLKTKVRKQTRGKFKGGLVEVGLVKVLVGCDGVNSVVAKGLGLRSAAHAGRSALRGVAEIPGGHGLGSSFLQYVGDGLRAGFVPCDDTLVYWFFTFDSSSHEEAEADMGKMKQRVLRSLEKAGEKVLQIVERTDTTAMIASPLRFRSPLDLLSGGFCRDGVCLAGDALHAMTPDLGQGGCAALEDSVILARCLHQAFKGSIDGELQRIDEALAKYKKERKWRSIELVCVAYIVGRLQQSGSGMVSLLRDKFLAPLLLKKLLTVADYDCGPLSSS